MADTRSNPMSPSLAGIVSDPTDAARRIVPASQRADGSVRKERKVRPGHVPAEDVAKYRPGQGSLRAQHEVAQASHQAPPSPSPAPAAPIRRPNPSDFLSESKLRETTSAAASNPPPSPTKASSKSGASSSRWAVAPSVVEPAPAPAIVAPTSPRLGNKPPRTRGGPRKGKAPAMHPVHAETGSQISEEEQHLSAHDSEEGKENVQPDKHPAEVQAQAESSVPSTPPPKIPDLPETPGGDWWADDDDDEEVDAAAQALQGISIKDAASRQRPASPSSTLATATSSRVPPVQQHSSNRQNNASSHTHRESQAPKSAKKSQLHSNAQNNKTPNGSKAPAGNLLSRLGPPVPILQQQPKVEKPATPASKESASIAKLTIEEIKSKGKSISQELRQMNQLRKYAEAGAVLSNEQRSQIDSSQALSQELDKLKTAADELAFEIAQLVESSRL